MPPPPTPGRAGQSARLARRPVETTLLTQEQCWFCDLAKEILDRIGRDYPLQVREVDLATEQVLRHGRHRTWSRMSNSSLKYMKSTQGRPDPSPEGAPADAASTTEEP